MSIEKKKNILIYAREHVTYYCLHLPEEIYYVEDIKHFEAVLRKIPIIDKRFMMRNIKCFISNEYIDSNIEEIISTEKVLYKEYFYIVNGKSVVVEFSSGTTGIPSISIKTIDERLILGNQLWKLRNSIYKVKGKEFFNFIHNFTQNQYPFPFSIDCKDTPEEKLKKELNYLSRNKFKWWHINSYRLGLYTEVLEHYKLDFPHLKVIENNGSYMSKEERDDIANRFNCMVVDNYGCREVWTIAFGCNCGYLHVNDRNIIFELVDDRNDVIQEADIVGNIVVTSLSQYAMPFIRYRTGDQAKYISGACSCGKSSKRIELLPGRNLIVGTEVYGNIHFRTVVRRTLLFHGKEIQSISVKQVGRFYFYVYIKSKSGKENSDFENRFRDISNELLKDNRYKYCFVYNEDVKPKSIFTVAK